MAIRVASVLAALTFVSLSLFATPQQKQFALASARTVKISVDRAGWIELRQPDLLAAGIAPNVDPRTLQLFDQGVQVAIVVSGQGDGHFDPSDVVRFYGRPLDTQYSAARVYWLTAGSAAGLRCAKAPVSSAAILAASGYPATVERHDKLIYDATLQLVPDGFVGPVVTNDPSYPAQQILALPHIDRSASTAQLEVALWGATGDGADPSHDVVVSVNGNSAGHVTFTGRDHASATFTVPTSWLVDGDNTIEMTATAGADDLSAVDHTRVTYQHTWIADDSALRFTAPGSSRVRLSGFATSSVRALDVTNPRNPVQLRVASTATPGTVVVSMTGSATRTVIATANLLDAPAGIEANVASSLHAAAGDVVVIAHRSLLPALDPLVSLRRTQGHRVVVASVDDVYDEYSFGAKTPAAIRSFLSAARNWSVPVRAVLLVGDATLDPRGYVGGADADLVPTKMLSTVLIRTASDGWLADFDGDGATDLAIGRLPVRTLADAQHEIAKIVDYETAPFDASWSRNALFVSGAEIGEPLGFRAATDGIRALFPDAYTATVADAQESGDAAAHAQVVQSWNAGTGVVSYIGHGTVDYWLPSIFGASDALALTNGSHLPIAVAITCLNGYFHDVSQESLAEAMLRADGGAVAVFALSTLAELPPQMDADRALVSKLVAQKSLGETLLAAQRATSDPDVRHTLMLFGDPLTRLR